MSRVTKQSLLSGVVLTALFSAASAQAQTAAPAVEAPKAPEPTLTEKPADKPDGAIVVTGTRASLERAVAIKRASASIVDAISAADVGKFPDGNIAESLQRIPGISIDRNSGEGQFVTVRGFGPQFNTVLVNGRLIASETASRAFSFDLFPSDILNGAEVYKTGTAVLQSGGIGATIDLKTARPLDRPGFHGLINVDGLHDGGSKQTTPEAFGMISDTFANNTVGVLLAVSYQQRKSQESFLSNDGWIPTQIGSGVNASSIISNPGNVSTVYLPRETANGITVQNRKRTNVQGALQVQATDTLRLTLDGFMNWFKVQSTSTMLDTYLNDFGAASLSNISLAPNGTVLSENVNSEIGSLVRETGRPTTSGMLGFNADWKASPTFTVNFDASYSKAKSNPAAAQDTGQAVVGLYPSQVSGGAPYQFNMTSGFPITSFNNAISTALTTPSAYMMHVAQYGNQTGDGTDGANTDNNVLEFKIDTKYQPDSAGVLKSIRAGMSFSRQQENVNYIVANPQVYCIFCGYYANVPSNLLTPVNLSGISGVPSGLQQQFYTFNMTSLINYMQSPAALAQLSQGALSSLGLAPGASIAQIQNAIASYGGFVGTVQPNSFSVNESVLSGYVDANLGGEFGSDGKWALDAGLRLVNDRISATGGAETLSSVSQSTPSQYTPVYGAIANTTNTHTTVKLLPTVNLTVSPTRHFTARAGFSQTITMPELSQLAPNFAFQDLRPGSFLATSGNTGLKPFTSTNFDASFEYYFNGSTFLTVAPFYKHVSNFIVQTATTQTVQVPGGINVSVADPNINTAANTINFTVDSYANSQVANVKGVEIAAQVGFTFLPGLLSHTGVGGNMTFVSSNAQIQSNSSVNTVFALPGLSNSQNAQFFYDDGRLDARVTWARRSAFLYELVNPKAGVGPVFNAPYSQIDFRVNYQLPYFGKMVSVFVDGQNVTNSAIRQYGQYTNQFLYYSTFGPRYSVGARVKF